MSFANPIIGSAGELIASQIKSPNYGVTTPAWIIRKDGTAEFESIIVNGDIQSSNFVTGTSGYFLDYSTGSAEFNDVSVRGEVTATQFQTDDAPNARIEISGSSLGQMQFFTSGGPDESLAVRSFLNNGQSQYIGAVEGPDNHPTEGRPHIYFVTDDGSVSATQPAVQLGIVGDSVISIAPSTLSLQINGGPSVALSEGASDTVQILTGASSGIALAFNTGTTTALMQSSNTGPYVLLTDSATTAVISNGTSYIEIEGDHDILLSADGGTDDVNIDADYVNIINAGSVGSPALIINGDLDTGIYHNGANDLVITAGGSAIGQFQLATGFNAYIGFTVQSAAPSVLTGSVKMTGLPASASAGQPVHHDNTFVPGTLYRFTSSGKYKREITDVPVSRVKKLLELKVREFQPYQPDTKTDEGPRRIGFIAEEIAEIDNRWALVGKDGLPSGIDSEQLIAALVETIQRIVETLPNGQTKKLWQ